MGKGDKRTRRGKLSNGSHGKTRSKFDNRSTETAKKRKKRA